MDIGFRDKLQNGAARAFGEIPAAISSLSPELLVAAEAARLGGALIRDTYGSIEACCEKKVRDPVTEVDIRSNEIVSGYLQRLYPGYGLISEEGQGRGAADGGRTWLVDPLDGTSAFYYAAGPHIPSVMIALLENGEPRLSVVYFPITDEWFYAEAGRGAYKNGERMDVTGSSRGLAASRVLLNCYSSSAYDTPEFLALQRELRSASGAGLVTVEAPNSGMACRLLESGSRIAAVIHDNSAASPKQELWDVKPIQLIVEEAGGCYLNLRGERYDAAKPEMIVVARSREIASAISALATGGAPKH